jgi:hypothetical protein
MAFKKKTHRRKAHRAVGRVRHRRRSRVSGISDTLMNAAGVVGGAAVGMFVNQALKTAFTTLPTWAPGVAILAGGAVLPIFVKGNPIVSAAACGLIAAGGLITLNETFLSVPGISGVGAVPRRLVYRNSPKVQRSVGAPGFMDNPINGMKDMNTIGALYDN